MRRHTRNLSLPRALALGFLALAAAPPVASGFTQSGAGTTISNGIPMGHEWITRLAGLELLGGDPIMPPDPNDPRRKWTQGRAKDLNLSTPGAQQEAARIRGQKFADQRYQSTYKAIYDVIMGERWVDIGGFNVTNAKLGSYNCFDAVTQEPAEIQYDHFMRRYDDREPDGGVRPRSNPPTASSNTSSTRPWRLPPPCWSGTAAATARRRGGPQLLPLRPGGAPVRGLVQLRAHGAHLRGTTPSACAR